MTAHEDILAKYKRDWQEYEEMSGIGKAMADLGDKFSRESSKVSQCSTCYYGLMGPNTRGLDVE